MRDAVRAAPLVDLYAHEEIYAAAHTCEPADETEDARRDALRSTERGIAVARVVEREARNLANAFNSAAGSPNSQIHKAQGRNVPWQ
jgi:hypothetical protein